MNYLENPNRGKQPENKYKDEKYEGLTRRDFLKAGAVLVGAFAIRGGIDLYNLIKDSSKDKNLKELERTDLSIEKIEEILEKELSKKEKNGEIEKVNFDADEKDAQRDDHMAVRWMLGKYNQKEVKLNEETKKATKNYWYIKYTAELSRLRKSLENAYIEIQPWVSDLRKIFKKEGVPEEYIYLAIPESHWNPNEDSPKGARGVYQIMPGTARSYGMRVDSEVDERTDILKSAECCAKHLKDTFKKTKDWDLALSGYNGSYVNRYIRFYCGSKKELNYAGFMEYLEMRVNGLKKWLAQSVWPHRVEPEQTLYDISKFFGVSWEVIAKYNKLKNNKNGQPIVLEKQWLRIPIDNEKVKEKIYNNIISGFIENLNYPGKFNAVWEIINESAFQERMKEKIKKE